MAFPRWYYDEMQAVGVDYHDPAQAAVYDEQHQRFRDYEKASAAVLARLGLEPSATVIDLGAGTGAFALVAARRCRTVYAVDVSQAMLAHCRQKAAAAGLDNIVFCHGGFLSYEHRAEPVDALVSVAVLHHLPDFWKLVGLKRAANMLRPGGRFYLFDVVFPGDLDGYAARFDNWVDALGRRVGQAFADEVVTHIRDEYSTCDWIMEGMLRRAGFAIESAEYADGFGATYLCVRP
jgi:putative AdoMet-dependent methyltransferase